MTLHHPHITILGAGAAGLAAGYYARQFSFPFTVFEAGQQVGGNAVTLDYLGFLFDSGAHRFHNQDPEITEEILGLMGKELEQINVPSQIYDHGNFIDFPLSPLNLVKGLGFVGVCNAAVEVLRNKLKNNVRFNDFESFALHTYGSTIANRFLLNYSEKLWGKPGRDLSPAIAGRRLEGLTLKSFLVEAIFGRRAKTQHLDGTFYYPTRGIGMIIDKLEQYCGSNNLMTETPVKRIYHDQKQITALELGGKGRQPVEKVVVTYALSTFLSMLEPAPPVEILSLARSLQYRNIILAVYLLNKESVSSNASIYFPDRDIPFTRLYEPKKRSKYMAPVGKTSLIAELPCQPEDELWLEDDQTILERVKTHLCDTGLIDASEVFDALIYRMPYAYPVLEKDYEQKMQAISAYTQKFGNLRFSGRNGLFTYIHIHDLMRIGKQIVADFSQELAADRS